MGDIKNVLFVTFDQWRADCVSAAGFDHIDTPVLDSLAADGTLFRNHFTNSAPCGPARTSLYTGLYPMTHRSVRNGTPLDARFTNVALEARKKGLEPALFGYTDASVDPRTVEGDDPRLHDYEGVLPGFTEMLRHGSPRALWEAWLAEKGHEFPRGIGFNWLPDREGHENEPLGFAPARLPLEDWDTVFVTDRASEYISSQGDKPWFVHLSYWAPHPPFVVPAPYHNRYHRNDSPAPVRAASAEDEAKAHPWLSYALDHHDKYTWIFGAEMTPATMSDEELAQIRSTYYGMVNQVEDCLGRIVEQLKASGQYDHTLIVVTSDHGEMLGDHWMLGKQGFFDSCYHVPLIIRDPRDGVERGRVVEAMTEAVDVTPTILHALGLPVPRAMTGRSLMPWINGEAPTDWRDYVMWEYDFRDVKEGKVEQALGLQLDSANLCVLRDRRGKYVHFAGLPPLFYDLENDPGELHNRADDPAYQGRVLDYAQRLISHRMACADRSLTHITTDEGYGEANWALSEYQKVR